MTAAVLTAAEGVATTALDRTLSNIPRSLYVYENVGVQPLAVAARGLYLYENVYPPVVLAARALYLYENVAIQDLEVLARSVYLYEALRDGEVFPWLMLINPNEQVRGGQVDLYGDGFGEILEVAADVGNVITASSTSGANVPGRAVDRATTSWVSTSAAGAWLRIAFPAPRVVVGLALEDLESTLTTWGVPLFRFSDGGADVNGAVAPLHAIPVTEYPVGNYRTYYALPAPRTVDWVEVRIASGGAGTNRGLSEVWVYTDTNETAENSEVLSNLGLADEANFGIVAWAGRSAGLWPSNTGVPVEVAATVTVPTDAESGMLVVRESI